MSTARSPAVAGQFYPADPRQLQAMVSGFLRSAKTSREIPKALIVPHAGYVYSGPIAASGYACLAGARGIIKRVVLLGPAHRVGFAGIALSSAASFITPLGKVTVDTAAAQDLAGLSKILVLDQAHAAEHSLEVHLPFLQEVLGEFTLVPLVVGEVAYETVATVLERLWGGPETLIVISSDLSHYHDYETARRLDAATSHAIEELLPEAIHHEHACGRTPINGLLTVARRLGMSVRTLDLRNSGDTAGTRDRVVGYGAYAFMKRNPEGEVMSTEQIPTTDAQGQSDELSSALRSVLLDVAGQAIDYGLSYGRPQDVKLADYPAPLQELRATFVTLQREKQLRGCIGSLTPHRPLVADVAYNAYAAAFSDPRFPKLSTQERTQLDIHISVLSLPSPMTFHSEADLLAQIRPGVDGLILEDQGRRGTFLPSVWESLPNPRDFWMQLKRKAGLLPNHWSATLRVSRYTTESFP